MIRFPLVFSPRLNCGDTIAPERRKAMSDRNGIFIDLQHLTPEERAREREKAIRLKREKDEWRVRVRRSERKIRLSAFMLLMSFVSSLVGFAVLVVRGQWLFFLVALAVGCALIVRAYKVRPKGWGWEYNFGTDSWTYREYRE